jgi:hypothetical protein
MYIVDHYNFGTSRSFDTYAAAKAFALRAGFDATVWHGDHRLASFSSISGWRTH